MAVTGLALSAVLFSLGQRLRPITLPAPTGPHAVGRAIEHWTDDRRPDPFAPQTAPRELMVFIWYPAQAGTGTKGTYLPDWWAKALGTRNQVQIGARDGAQIAADSARFPVLVLSAGLGSLPNELTALAEDLASHGYLVISPAATYSASRVVFPDGRQVASTPAATDIGLTSESFRELVARVVPVWTDDLGFVLRRLEDLNQQENSRWRQRLDLTRVGAVGHSLGGLAVVELCNRLPSCAAAINLDGFLLGNARYAGPLRPLFMLSSPGCPPALTSLIADTDAAVRAAAVPVLDLEVSGMDHADFTDIPFLRTFWQRARRPGNMLGPKRSLAITRRLVRAFFDDQLRGISSPLLANPQTEFPEIYPRPKNP